MYSETLLVAIRGFLVRREFATAKRAQEEKLLQIIQLQACKPFLVQEAITYHLFVAIRKYLARNRYKALKRQREQQRELERQRKLEQLQELERQRKLLQQRELEQLKILQWKREQEQHQRGQTIVQLQAG